MECWSNKELFTVEAHQGEVPAEAGNQIGYCTAETLRSWSKEFFLKKYSELCVLCASVVNLFFAPFARAA